MRARACRATTGPDPTWCQATPSWDRRCGWAVFAARGCTCGERHRPSLHGPCWRLVRSGRRGPIRRPKTKTYNMSDQVRDLGPSVMFCGRKHVVTGRFVATGGNSGPNSACDVGLPLELTSGLRRDQGESGGLRGVLVAPARHRVKLESLSVGFVGSGRMLVRSRELRRRGRSAGHQGN